MTKFRGFTLPTVVYCRLVFQPARRRPGERRRLLVDAAHVDQPVLRLVQSRPRANLVVPVRRHATGTAEDAGGLRRGRPRMADLADGHLHLRRDGRHPRRREGHVALRGDVLADRPVLRDRRERQHRQEPDGDPRGLSHRVRGQEARGHLIRVVPGHLRRPRLRRAYFQNFAPRTKRQAFPP